MAGGGGQAGGGFTAAGTQNQEMPVPGETPAWANNVQIGAPIGNGISGVPYMQQGAPPPSGLPYQQGVPVQQGAPDQNGNAAPGTATNASMVSNAMNPYLMGDPGSSPLMQAGVNAFNVNMRPIIEQQMQLQGLGRSPAVGVATADALAGILPQFITEDHNNRFRAAGMLQGEEGLNQSAASLAANIANQEAMRRLQAYQASGQMQLGMGQLYNQSYANQLQQMQMGLQAAGAGGELQRLIAQGGLDAAQLERLRLQGLSESATSGIFGNVISALGLSSTLGNTSGGGK